MVNEFFSVPAAIAPAIRFVPADRRAGVAALFALDATLGSVLRTTREPLVGRMRLTWWFEALERLDAAPPPAEPILRALAGEVVTRGVSGAMLATMIDGWEMLFDDEASDDAALERFAAERGRRLFMAAATVLGAGDGQVAAAGEGWALADLAANMSRVDVAARAEALATRRLKVATGRRWSRAGRALGALALKARLTLERRSDAARGARRLLFRVTGR